jgi:threonine/homoserine/homoserine lactone efflux protein
MIPALVYLIKGISLGAAAGVSPGPFTMVVISESLAHGSKAGYRAALAPFITDTPIIIASVFILSRVAQFDMVLACISLVGSVILFSLAYKSFTLKESSLRLEKEEPKSLRKAILVNFTNPNPYLFWLTICGPLLVKSYNESGFLAPIAFLVSFYALLIGIKMTFAFIAGKTHQALNPKKLVRLNQILAIVLVVYACLFLKEGMMGIIN